MLLPGNNPNVVNGSRKYGICFGIYRLHQGSCLWRHLWIYLWRHNALRFYPPPSLGLLIFPPSFRQAQCTALDHSLVLEGIMNLFPGTDKFYSSSIAPCLVVCVKNAHTTFSSNSPSLKMLFI